MPSPNYHRFLELLCKPQLTSSEAAEATSFRTALVRRVGYLGQMDAADANDVVSDHIEKLLRLGLAQMTSSERDIYAYGMVASLSNRVTDLVRKRARARIRVERGQDGHDECDPFADIPAPDCAGEAEFRLDLQVLARNAHAALVGSHLDAEVSAFCSLLIDEIVACVQAGEPVRAHVQKQLTTRGWSEQRARNERDRAFRLAPIRRLMQSLERLARDTQARSAVGSPDDRPDVR